MLGLIGRIIAFAIILYGITYMAIVYEKNQIMQKHELKQGK